MFTDAERVAWDRGAAAAKADLDGTADAATVSVTAPGGGLDWCLTCQRPLPRKKQERLGTHCDCWEGRASGVPSGPEPRRVREGTVSSTLTPSAEAD